MVLMGTSEKTWTTTIMCTIGKVSKPPSRRSGSLRSFEAYKFSLDSPCICIIERQFVHDSIIEEYMERVEAVHPKENGNNDDADDYDTTPWLILTCGVRGAGKQHVKREH